MNKHQELAIKALGNMMGDNTARARAQFSIYTMKQMNEPYGAGGKTPMQILKDYEAHDSEVQSAMDWVRAQNA